MSRKNKTEKTEYYLFGFPINKRTIFCAFAVLIFLIADGILIDELENQSDSFRFAFFVLGMYFVAYYYHNVRCKEDNETEIAQLKQEISKLENIRKSDEQIIDLLEKENEQLQDKINFYETNE